MSLIAARLGPWWAPAALAAGGVAAMVLLDRTLVGGVLAGAAFALAAALRVLLPTRRAGGLVVRSTSADLFFYTLCAVNLIGGVLLVLRHVPLVVVAAADAALLAWGVLLVVRVHRAARRGD